MQYYLSSLYPMTALKKEDIFGTKEIYPTKPGGKEWFLNSDDPRSDGIFFITSDKNITRQSEVHG